MTLTRWSPVSALAALEVGQLNRMFGIPYDGQPFEAAGWVPAVDVLETAGGEVVVKAELPGMKREDIAITFENNVLTIEGERKFAGSADAEDRYHRVERGYGTFRRSFTLPASVDASGVEATYRDGVLAVTLPRREEMRPRQIKVNG